MKKKVSRFMRFMNQRYGTDKLYFFMFTCLMLLLVLNFMLDSAVILISALALLVYMMYRVFSLDHKKRRMENEKFLKISGRVKAPIIRYINMYKLRNTYTFSKCKKCSAVICAPKENQSTKVVCSKCGAENIIKKK